MDGCGLEHGVQDAPRQKRLGFDFDFLLIKLNAFIDNLLWKNSVERCSRNRAS